jgi:NADPH2:quinone reductase
LVHGASGTVGLAAVQFARAASLRVIGTASSARGRAVVHEQGASLVLEHHGPALAEAVFAATGGAGVDLIVEMLANENLGTDLTLLAPRGRVMIVGSRGPVEVNPRDAMVREATIRRVFFFRATPMQLASAHDAIGALVERTVRPLVAEEFALADAPHAHVAVLGSHAPGKIVLLP